MMNNIGQLLQAIFGMVGQQQPPELSNILSMLQGLRFPGFGQGQGGGQGGQPGGGPFNWWQRPMHPFGNIDPAAMDAYRQAMQGWRDQRPQRPMPTPPTSSTTGTSSASATAGSANPQGNAWGFRFNQQYGKPPGQMRDQFKMFKGGMGGQ